MSTQHTPGPWEKNKYGQVFGPATPQSKHSNGRVFIAHIVDEKGRHFPNVDTGILDEAGQADARLIAAAPDLLEACQALTAAYGIGEWRLRSIDIARDLALEAVQKAVE